MQARPEQPWHQHPTPEQSDYTSIQQRIAYWKQRANNSVDNAYSSENLQPENLMPFAGNLRQPMPTRTRF